MVAVAALPDVLEQAPTKAETHRALDDIRESIAELAYYRSTVFVPGGSRSATLM